MSSDRLIRQTSGIVLDQDFPISRLTFQYASRCKLSPVVIFVDLDEHPKLGEFYGVTAVPDVFMINGDGFVVDRFQTLSRPTDFESVFLSCPPTSASSQLVLRV